ncbi:hypothetical protein OIU77_024370 [Salix suchowensis]|uniref:Uncharacterized protein n=1 Tax=Salix suchowensis TaxID=1278906 RepID=A0ABQ9BWK7_9ROSI|nr:hypothetical protein OIU77_024370 [Salix suchowensis]
MAKLVKSSAPLFVFLAFYALLVSGASGSRGGMVGGRTKLSDVKTNKEVQELGRFSVKEFNNDRRKYEKGGEVGAAAKKEKRMFDSVLVVKPWLRSKELLTFEPSTEPRVRE